MDYTKNYHLPQWVKSDRIMMDDFNAAMASMENGMTASDGKSENALSTANTAHSLAAAAKKTADAAYSPSQKPYVAGSYVGRGADVTVNLGFRPSFVIVSGMQGSPSTSEQSQFDRYFAMTGGRTLKGRIDFTDNGFIARTYNSTVYPDMSTSGRTYDYIAFR